MMGIFGVKAQQSLGEQLARAMAKPFGNRREVHTISSNGLLLGAGRNALQSRSQDVLSCSEELGIQVAFAGEILNRGPLLRYLVGQHPGDSAAWTDADLFLHLFARLGSAAVEKVNGFFSAAVWDSANQRLHLLLDRIGGFHNLYYSATASGFAFSSNLHSLLSLPWISRVVDPCSLFDFFTTGYVLPPHTFLKGISKARPGEEIVFDGTGLTSRIVDRLHVGPKDGSRRSPQQFKQTLQRSIANAAADDAKKAYLLSGGIDSSTIVAIACAAGNGGLDTYSASFPGTGLDESAYAKCVADHYRCNGHFLDLSGNESLEALPEIVWHLDEPLLDWSVIPVYHLLKEVRKNAPVVIGGDGPDHLFGRYYPLAAKLRLSRFAAMLKLLGKLSRVSFFDKIHRVSQGRLADAYRDLFLLPAWGIENVDNLTELFSPELRTSPRESRPYFDMEPSKAARFEDLFDRLACLDLAIDGSFGVFLKVGKMARANDLVVREPFLDREVVDFVLNLPRQKKVRGNMIQLLSARAKTKYIMKHEICPAMLPEMVLKKAKGGFSPPLGAWLKGTICQLPIDRILSPTVRDANYFNLSFLERIIREHREGYRDWSTLVFMLISFDLWARMNLQQHSLEPSDWKLSDVYS